MNWFDKLRIADKLGFMGATVILLFSFLAGIILWSSLSEVMRGDLDERGTIIAAEIAGLSNESIQSGDFFALDELIHIAKQTNSFVEYILVVDNKNKIMAHTFSQGIPKKLLSIHPIDSSYEKNAADIINLRTDHGVIHDLLYPIEDGAIGYIRIGVNENALDALLMSNILKLLFITAMVVFIGAIFVFKLTNIITRPLKKLIQRAEAISQGDFSQQMEVRSDDEVGKLVRAINVMAEHLNKSEAERKRLLSHLLTAQEDERKRISRELHDESGQALTALLLSMRALANQTEDEMQRQYIMEVRDETHNILQKLRNLAVELRPPALDELGIEAVINKMIFEYERYYNIKIDFIAELPPKMDSMVSLAIYRIVQESLTNIFQHAKASKAEIHLKAKKYLELVIKDNGIGISEEDIIRARKNNHLGIYGIQERVQLLGGKMEITQEKPGWSTVFHIILNLR